MNRRAFLGLSAGALAGICIGGGKEVSAKEVAAQYGEGGKDGFPLGR